MKQFVIVLLASLLGVLIALVVYDRTIVAPREAAQEKARLAAQEQARTVSLSHAEEQAQQIARALDDSVDRSVEHAREGMDKLAGEMNRRGLANEALARASMVRVQLTEYYMSEGRWPENGAEAGIAPAAEFAGGGVAGIDVERGGRIAIRLNDRVSANARFRLSPQVSEATGMVRWHCELQGAPDIAAQLTTCRD
jgi:hypothetical protein